MSVLNYKRQLSCEKSGSVGISRTNYAATDTGHPFPSIISCHVMSRLVTAIYKNAADTVHEIRCSELQIKFVEHKKYT
jgi:hypothetical protein